MRRSNRKAHASDKALAVAGGDAPADAPDPKLQVNDGAQKRGGARPVADITADAARLARRASSGGDGRQGQRVMRDTAHDIETGVGAASANGDGRQQGQRAMRDTAHDIEMGGLPSCAGSTGSARTTMDLPLLLQEVRVRPQRTLNPDPQREQRSPSCAMPRRACGYSRGRLHQLQLNTRSSDERRALQRLSGASGCVVSGWQEPSASLAEPEPLPAAGQEAALRRSPFQRPSLQLKSMSEDSAEGAAVPSPYQGTMVRRSLPSVLHPGPCAPPPFFGQSLPTLSGCACDAQTPGRVPAVTMGVVLEAWCTCATGSDPVASPGVLLHGLRLPGADVAALVTWRQMADGESSSSGPLDTPGAHH